MGYAWIKRLALTSRGAQTDWSSVSPRLCRLGGFSGPGCLAAPPQLEQVVCGGYQTPLASNSAVPAPHEAVARSQMLDVTKHSLYHPATFAVELRPPLGPQLALHPASQGQALRNASTRGSLLSQRLSLLPALRRSNEQFRLSRGWVYYQGEVR